MTWEIASKLFVLAILCSLIAQGASQGNETYPCKSWNGTLVSNGLNGNITVAFPNATDVACFPNGTTHGTMNSTMDGTSNSTSSPISKGINNSNSTDGKQNSGAAGMNMQVWLKAACIGAALASMLLR